jgi:hypothetical protein
MFNTVIHRKLNKRQLAYCYWRARDCSMEEAMIKAGYRCKGVSARNVGVKLEKNAYIVEQIEKERLTIFDSSKITTEYVLEGLNNLAQNAVKEDTRVRAFELLGKYLAMFKDKLQVSGNITYTPEEQSEISAIKNRMVAITTNN